MEYPEYHELIAFIKGELNERQQANIRNWIAASPAHQQHFEKTREIWNNHGHKAEAYQPDLKVAWTRIENRIEPKAYATWKWLYRVAAVLVIALGISFFLVQQGGTFHSSTPVLVETPFTTTVRDILLPDGTSITLNRGATVSYDTAFDQKVRFIKLKGEAFFDVARDEARPFIIETEKTQTKVMGTSFSIAESGDHTTLTVVSGKVAFSSGGKEPLFLVKGDRGTYTGAGQLIKSQNTDRNFLSWKTGELTFQNDPLITVLQHLDRHFGVSFQSEASATLTLTAQFKDQPLPEILDIISGTLELDIQPLDQTNYIVKPLK